MKELLMSIITKIVINTKVTIIRISNSLKFEGKKTDVIKVMLDPIIKSKLNEQNILFSELNNIKLERIKLQKKIKKLEEENAIYKKKISVINSFQFFILDNQ